MDDYPDPITQQGRVATNGLLDRDEVKLRQVVGHDPARPSLYGGPIDDAAFDIFQYDLCVEIVRPDTSRVDYAEPQPYVLSVANGAFKNNETVEEVLPRLQFRGFAAADAKYDPGNNETQLGVALQQGGLITVKNTGSENIRNGDWLYFDLPNPRDPYEKKPRGSSRIPFVIKPYDPMRNKVFASSIGSGLAGRNGARSTFEMREGAMYLRWGIAALYVDAYFAFANSGLMAFDEDALTDGQKRRANARAFQLAGPDGRQTALHKLAAALHARDLKPTTIDVQPSFPLGTPAVPLDQYIMDVFLGRTPSAQLAPLSLDEGSGARQLPGGIAGTLLSNQQAALQNMVDGIVAANFSVQRRVFGKAITAATPGNKLDVFLGGVAS